MTMTNRIAICLFVHGLSVWHIEFFISKIIGFGRISYGWGTDESKRMAGNQSEEARREPCNERRKSTGARLFPGMGGERRLLVVHRQRDRRETVNEPVWSFSLRQTLRVSVFLWYIWHAEKGMTFGSKRPVYTALSRNENLGSESCVVVAEL